MPSKFGAVIGVAPGGVEAYSSDYKTADEALFPTRASYRSSYKGVYTGFCYQCVEFARRWLIQTRGATFGDVGMAYEIMDLPYFTALKGEDTMLPVAKTVNGKKGARPVLGSVILWNPAGYFRNTGHVAIVTEATDAFVRVAEQNVTDAPWPGGADYARELPVKLGPDGEYTVLETHRNSSVLGWVTIDEVKAAL
jgi:glutathionylspermidine amidase/synthetase